MFVFFQSTSPERWVTPLVPASLSAGQSRGPCGNTNMPDYTIDYAAIFRHESRRLLLASAGLNLQSAAVQRATDGRRI